MLSFDLAVTTVLEREGGYVDHPSDPGGATNYGISKRFLERIGKTTHPRDLNKAQAVDIYRLWFWEPYPFSKWADSPSLAYKLFDATVNMGPAQAMKCFQRALRSCGQRQVTDDGVYGRITSAARSRALGEFGEKCILVSLRSELAGFYRMLIAMKSERRAFERGWLRRAYDE